MKKRLYLTEPSLGFLKKSKEQTGELTTNKPRAVTGTEKDGSPQYRYFDSQAEYEEYLSKERKGKTGPKDDKGIKGDKKDMKERLQTKLRQEQGKSSQQTKETASKKVSGQHSKNRSLYAGHTASVKKFSVKKSVSLYLGEK
jgi:hypothetical protein